MGTNCAPLIADLFFVLLWRNFHNASFWWYAIWSYLSFKFNFWTFGQPFEYQQSFFEGVVTQINPTELHLNKANCTDTAAQVLDLHLSISTDLVSSKIFDNREDLILTWVSISSFWMTTFLVPLIVVITYLS